MNLDPEICYQAAVSRDRRFDGRFFTAVTTTGIYCRPVCPARTPKRSNVRFFACAAAAEEAGFRPCRRCRPETSPGTPAWLGTSATVTRALRLIAEGALDEGSIDDLAARVGVGARHLRRLFNEELGASPLAIAQTQRAHFARRLLDETDLPIGEIAFSAGFNSVRRFNDVTKRSFGRTPSDLRRATEPTRKGGALRLRLPFRPPYDWDSLARFLAARAIPGVEEVGARSYRRTFAADDAAGTLEVSPVPGEAYLLLRLTPPETRGLGRVVERARRIFDCDADPAQIVAHLSADPLLAPLAAAFPGLRVPGAWDGFELAVRAVLGQQVSVRGATTLAGRLVERWGEPIEGAAGNLTRLFPSADALAGADLAAIGLPKARAEAIRALAAAVRDGAVSFDAPGDLDDALEALERVPGVGAWTANYVAMRALGEPDAFPAGDLGLRKAAAGGGEPVSARELERRAEAWRPWRAYAAMYLWRGLAPENEGENR